MARWSDWLSFGFGLGFIWPSGTMGSLLGLSIYMWLVFLPSGLKVLALLGVTALFWNACLGTYCRLDCDHKAIVGDEVVGVIWALWWLPETLLGFFWGFVLFRLFDIIKVGPVRWIDRAPWGGHGVMADDIAASGLVGLTYCIFRIVVVHW